MLLQAPPVPPSSSAKPGDWTASTVTKRDEKRSRSLGLISSDEGNVIFPAVEETRASPMKRSIGGFADEDDLLDFDDTFIEPPPKKARSDAVSWLPQLPSFGSQGGSCGASFDCLLSFQRERCSCCCCSSFSSDKIRLQEEARSSSSKLDGAIKKAAVARQEVDSLKEELSKLKERLKEEEARAAKRMNSSVNRFGPAW
ncbi:hypothetical protein QYE76_040265 [Lolium multiflorum]|uniref:Uncharacterized protein n=1 Tax=Lolium multiflorum TaxID=4521 RepID=A0AAD8TCN0_LOLMU|nr:hypothetical protein QYE76_040265 [Lolium multiflorum]